MAILEAHAPKMRLVEAQCAHRKHCYPEPPLGSHPTSRVSQYSLVAFQFFGASRFWVGFWASKFENHARQAGLYLATSLAHQP